MMEEARPLIVCEDLHKEYSVGESVVHALRGASLSINKGEILIVLGPSGAGKSTLLHVLGALDRPTSGTVLFRETEMSDLSQREMAALRRSSFGFVFQFHHLIPELSVIENVMAPGLIARKGKAGSKVRASELLEDLGLSDRAGHRPSQISGGERQRAAVARALFNSPDVIFCDEPTGNLDSETGKLITGLITKLNKEKGITFVVVTHDRSFIEMGSRTVQMVDGRIT